MKTRTVLPRPMLMWMLLVGLSTVAHAESRQEKTLADAKVAFEELQGVEDAGIPDKLLEKCRCVAVFPGVVKGALGVGGRMGRGVLSCRNQAGTWSPPSFMTLTGGGFGFQIGIQKADIVLFIMTERGAKSFLESEFSLGAKGAVAVGPMGRSVEGSTDLKLDAEIYSYARSKGLFAGISLEGARVNSDQKSIRAYYGEDIEPEQIVFKHKPSKIPVEASAFMKVLPGLNRQVPDQTAEKDDDS